ncbi:MAG: UvrD-helicase domain-containing protein [Betaproteobacteria bacterium]|nr:UvrD-helicase domain-containing protein [Betaproteobacteria bacterium]
MRIPTPEQQNVLESAARVRVVRAAPGSGKTWLVAEVIRTELERWPKRTSGIAALSFTRVGGDEIRRAIGHELGHPHFVGTIDAFLFRYVIRPHLRRVFNWSADPRILVGEWGAEHWGYYGTNQTTKFGQGINIFSSVCIDEEQGEVVIAHKPHPAQPLRKLIGNELSQVNAAKEEVWKNRGLLTHSDAALWASKILEHPTLGAVVRAEVIRRFPFLIVDELQDTGHFLGKSIRLLLEEPRARGLLVGDPDQAIYEFTGARPDRFNTFETIPGAVSLTLASSLRCPSAVADVAKHVKDSGGVIGPAEDQVGRALLVRYNDMAVDVPRLVETVRAIRITSLLKVIARALTTVEDLAGRRAGNTPSLYCPPLTHIHRAVVAFRRGRNISALSAARAALERAVFQHEGVIDEELTASNIDPRDWKALAVRCLLKVNAIATTGTTFDWHTQAGETLDGEISVFGLGPSPTFVTGKLKPQRRDGWDKPSADFLPQPNAGVQALAGIPVQTVHGVKGETHDVTVFVCPPTTQAARCPSAVWWSPNDKDREEKRIAYVAMTRTQGSLIVCVSDASHQRLAANRAAFVASFECMTVDECVNALRGESGQENRRIAGESGQAVMALP